MKFKALFLRRVKARAFDAAVAENPDLTQDQFIEALDRAYANGALSDDKILMRAAEEDPKAFGDGTILNVIKKIIDWLSDPANQHKIQNIVKFIMTILAAFGL